MARPPITHTSCFCFAAHGDLCVYDPQVSAPCPPADLVQRFTRDLGDWAGGKGGSIGLAVSGGPDSLALLMLAAAALPNRVEAATVDHGLRRESGREAALVARVTANIGVAHAVLEPGWDVPPARNVPAAARAARYQALQIWAAERKLACILTAHHLDDQAETLLMRLGRGSGLSGLAGVRRATTFSTPGGTVRIVRPLLEWRKAELQELVAAAGVAAVEDPTNDDEGLDRTHVRRWLATAPQLDPLRIAAAAANLADADAALEWTADTFFRERAADGGAPAEILTLAADDLPHELQRRLLLRALSSFTDGRALPGPKVETLLASLRAGRPATLAGVRVRPGPPWQFAPAPPRRH